MTVREMLRRGEFNDMSQSVQDDGSLLVVLTSRGDPRIYRMWVRDLYKSTEIVIREKITNGG